MVEVLETEMTEMEATSQNEQVCDSSIIQQFENVGGMLTTDKVADRVGLNDVVDILKQT